MATHYGATLIAEVGTATTRLTLVDLVDSDFRLITRVETPTALASESDLPATILHLATMIGTITGRELVRDGQLLMPGDGHGNGVGGLVVTTSAAGPIPMVIAALATEGSTREAMHAAGGIYSVVEHVLALDTGGAVDRLWLGQQVMIVAKTKPDVILLAGGLEGRPTPALERLGQIMALLTQHLQLPPEMIYAGNSAAADAVRAAMSDGVTLRVVDNLRPAPNGNRLVPAREALAQSYAARRLPALPGYQTLRTWRAGYVGSVAEDQAIMVRFLAERFGRDVLGLDVGATHSAAQLQANAHYSQAVLTNIGVGPSSVALLDSVGIEAIMRWLPYDLSADELRNRLLNRILWPSIPPADFNELLLDQALIREALAATLSAIQEARGTMHYDLVIAGGAMARAPRPGLTALTLLDTLVGDGQQSRFAVDLFLDSFGLLAASGALAHLDPDAAVCLLEHDALNNGPLATVLVPHGDLVIGQPVLEAELTLAQGDVQRITVAGGEIARLPLDRGQRATLRIQPAPGIRVGDNAPGAEVLSDEAAVAGSALGVLIDARPRPLALPEEAQERARVLYGWLEALDARPPAPVPRITAASRTEATSAGEVEVAGQSEQS